ncbi:MAG: hypothetical protein A2V70_08020 [Planctomycetes bacterium RBG_13_63_9]|nr:MAG: hypothetical protein A2V70_08020 [Planctomycetes bacterium RBG_13_63_9]
MICTFVLSIGLLGLAALIPVGRLAIVQTAIADRSGACGRAALREIKIRQMLEPDRWLHFNGPRVLDDGFPVAPFVIDPLFLGNYGSSGSAPPHFGNTAGAQSVLRFTLDCPGISPSVPMSYALAERIFRWRDDLEFDNKDPDRRPVGTNPDGSPGYKGDYSWFITVSPAPAEATLPNAIQKRRYLVSAVVCFKRDLTVDESNMAVAEHTAGATFLGMGYGGGSVEIAPGEWRTPPPERIRDNQWIMICGGGHALWYRVISVSEGSEVENKSTFLTLAGPDWSEDTSNVVQAIFIDGVVGVYTTTIERQ